MTEEQVKAAKSLQRALNKCMKADMRIYAYQDAGFFVAPTSVREHDSHDLEDGHPSDYYEEHGVCMVGVDFSSGAGA